MPRFQPPHQTAHAVLPHTAFRDRSPRRCRRRRCPGHGSTQVLHAQAPTEVLCGDDPSGASASRLLVQKQPEPLADVAVKLSELVAGAAHSEVGAPPTQHRIQFRHRQSPSATTQGAPGSALQHPSTGTYKVVRTVSRSNIGRAAFQDGSHHCGTGGTTPDALRQLPHRTHGAAARPPAHSRWATTRTRNTTPLPTRPRIVISLSTDFHTRRRSPRPVVLTRSDL